MVAQTEVFGKTFDEAFEGFRKTAESTLHLQQHLFRQWVSLWPGLPKPPAEWAAQVQKFQKEWTQTVTEMTQKYQDSWDAQYKAGMQVLGEAFHLAETKGPDELRKKTEELWGKTFDCLKGLAQAQVRDFQAASEKWVELMTKPKA
jgi:hypothetical protein